MARQTSNLHSKPGFAARWLLAALVLSLSVIGCKGTVGYETNPDNVNLAPHRLPVTVAVLKLADDRPQEEVKADHSFLTWWDKTDDSSWKNDDLPAAISDMASRHLDACGIFAHVAYVADSPEKLDQAELAKLHGMGYDMVLTGKIEHFTGTRRWDLTRAGLFTLAGPIGTGVNMALGHQAGGLVSFHPLTLVRTTDGLVMWGGEAVGECQETTYISGTANTYANESLKSALNDLSHRLDDGSAEIAARMGCPRQEVALPDQPPAEPSDPSLVDKTLDQGKKGIQAVGKTAAQAGKALDSAIDKVIDVVK